MDREKFIHHFPNIREKCLSIGIDVAKSMIPVAPAAHYSCGGIKTDEWARTSFVIYMLQVNAHLPGFTVPTGLRATPARSYGVCTQPI